MRPWTLASMVGLLALAGAAGWYVAGDANHPGVPPTPTSSNSAAIAGSRSDAPSQPAIAAVPSPPVDSSAAASQQPADARVSRGFVDHTEYASTPGTTALPPELRREDVEIDPQTGMMTVKRIPSEPASTQQPTEILGPRDLPPGDVEIDPQTGQMTLKRYQQ